MIEFLGVTKSFRTNDTRKSILNGMTMRLPRANIAVIGANGAGKSTFLRLIAGTSRPDTGEIRRHVDVSWPLGFRGAFHPELSAAENIRFIARIYNQDFHEVSDFVRDFAELGAYFYQPVKQYSSGMRARLAFGVSMAISFDLYLIDEITSVGDQRFRARSREVFNDRLSQSNIIMVSHSAKTLRDYCQCGLLLQSGTITFFEDVNDAISAHEELNLG